MKKPPVIIFAAVVVLLLVIFAVFSFEQTAKNRPAPSAAMVEPHLYRDFSPVLGADNAKVTIVEFMDPACEACRAFYPFVKQQLAQYDGQVKLVMRLLPFHRDSDQVIAALEAAKQQDKYWQALHVALKYQADWAINHTAHVDKLLPLLAEVDIDIERLKKDMKNPEIAKIIAQESQDAQSLGVDKTPSFFVNSKPLTQFGYDQLAELIADEVAAEYPAQ
ncbi:thioredoxin-like protein [Sinobacterium caligoides]|uniref:Thioredoxin-like protein n=1 Tax=Sinobacterium caligoides TaxID=933926 RepID=A0A3N2DZT9_9GAMM|nr:thioredoxin domain-containing protein [Sinobacterium caligoides]ROS04949.1 thioredoxin-like protein [Sinobacterium caligoides]